MAEVTSSPWDAVVEMVLRRDVQAEWWRIPAKQHVILLRGNAYEV